MAIQPQVRAVPAVVADRVAARTERQHPLAPQAQMAAQTSTRPKRVARAAIPVKVRKERLTATALRVPAVQAATVLSTMALLALTDRNGIRHMDQVLARALVTA